MIKLMCNSLKTQKIKKKMKKAKMMKRNLSRKVKEIKIRVFYLFKWNIVKEKH